MFVYLLGMSVWLPLLLVRVSGQNAETVPTEVGPEARAGPQTVRAIPTGAQDGGSCKLP
jgi:hypothetical protein